MSWPSTTIGLRIVPQSSTITTCSTVTTPVSTSTSTTAATQPFAYVSGGSYERVEVSTGSMPGGRLPPTNAPK